MNEAMKQIEIYKRNMAKACVKQEGIIHFSKAYHCIN